MLYFRWRSFTCWRCTGAIYASQSQDAATRLQMQFKKLRERVRPETWDRELNYFPRRPKRMRHVTYSRLRNRALAKLERYRVVLDEELWRAFSRLAPGELETLLGRQGSERTRVRCASPTAFNDVTAHAR